MNESLDCEDYAKYLGVLIDYNISWKSHIEYLALKINKTVVLVAVAVAVVVVLLIEWPA